VQDLSQQKKAGSEHRGLSLRVEQFLYSLFSGSVPLVVHSNLCLPVHCAEIAATDLFLEDAGSDEARLVKTKDKASRKRKESPSPSTSDDDEAEDKCAEPINWRKRVTVIGSLRFSYEERSTASITFTRTIYQWNRNAAIILHYSFKATIL